MDQKETNWRHIISVGVGDSKLAFFRTKIPNNPSKQPNGHGHGYFVLLFFAEYTNTKKMEVKLPLKLLPFLRKKHKEFMIGNKKSEAIEIDDNKFSLVAWPDNDDVQMSCHNPATDTTHLAKLKMNDLKKLIMCLEALGLMIKNQPERVESEDEYLKYANELMCWATAKCAYNQVVKLLEPGKAVETAEQYGKLWLQVFDTRYDEFKACIDKFAVLVKDRVPVYASTDTVESLRLREEFPAFGFLYSRPLHEWQPMQFLVDCLYLTGGC